MPPKSRSKSKVRDLERVRLNQQRSRARRKEYTASLEDKVAQLENELQRSRRSIDTIAQLEREKAILSDVLCVLGIDVEYQRRLLDSASKAEVLKSFLTADEEVVHDQFPVSTDSHAPYELSGSDKALSNQSADLPAASSTRPPGTRMRQLRPRLATTSNDQSQTTSSPEACCACPAFPTPAPSPQTNKTRNAPSSAANTPNTTDFTTACSVAKAILTSNNKRGFSMGDLEKRMRQGYLKGNSPGDECRIRNQVFFNVLAEIVQ